jgi:hypothetical protein
LNQPTIQPTHSLTHSPTLMLQSWGVRTRTHTHNTEYTSTIHTSSIHLIE